MGWSKGVGSYEAGISNRYNLRKGSHCLPHKRQVMRLPIEKRQVWQAYQAVRLNDGTHGADMEEWEAFDRKRYHNLYQIWNRVSSGAYFPKAVRRAIIRKEDGGERPLGIPCIRDRIVQEVLRVVLEPYLE